MKISTVLVLLGIFIISLYFLIEVQYYAGSVEINTNPVDTPYLKIPKIGVNQSINNQSIDYGVYHEPQSYKPGSGTVILFGHRTLHGSPFLNLDKLQAGDKIYLDWPGIGTAEYSVLNWTIVDASYMMPVEQGNKLFLITCYPLGSDAQRLIIEANFESLSPLQTTQNVPNPQYPYAIMLIAGFFGAGMLLTYFYPVKDDKIFVLLVVLALSILLAVSYLYPLPTGGLESQLSKINSLLGV